jgi:hypothetical protein
VRSWTDRSAAFLSIDVEPDGFQLDGPEEGSWSGMEAMVPFVESLRTRLHEVSGSMPAIGWYFRLDPQIETVFGRPDFAVQAFARVIADLGARGDYFGIHPHLLRRDDPTDAWVHDFADADFAAGCTRRCAEVYADAFGEPPRRQRFGAGILNDAIVDEAERCGIAVDLSLEPSNKDGHAEVRSGIDRTLVVGAYPDLSRAPRTAYRPARGDFRTADPRSDRTITLVPLSSTTRYPRRPPVRRVVRRVVRGRSGPRVLYPTMPWPSPRVFWDLVQRELEAREHRHVSLAVRTDHPSSLATQRVRTLFEYLPGHPIAERLRLVDPLSVLGARA